MKKYKLIINGEKYETKIIEYKGNYAKVSVNDMEYEVEIEKREKDRTELASSSQKTSDNQVIYSPSITQQNTKASQPKLGNVIAPIPGTILDIKVKENETVTANDVVVILEAMKMESEIYAGFEGKVKAIRVSKGDSVQEGAVLIEIGVD